MRGNSGSGPGAGAPVGNGAMGNGDSMGPGEPVRHGWFCWCIWCLIGHR